MPWNNPQWQERLQPPPRPLMPMQGPMDYQRRANFGPGPHWRPDVINHDHMNPMMRHQRPQNPQFFDHHHDHMNPMMRQQQPQNPQLDHGMNFFDDWNPQQIAEFQQN